MHAHKGLQGNKEGNNSMLKEKTGNQKICKNLENKNKGILLCSI